MADLKSYFQGYDLDSGGGTDYVLGVNLRLTTSGGSIEALGQQTMAVSIPVTIASNQSAITVDTELTAAVALADALGNPTTATVGALAEIWNGSTWDRHRSVVNAQDTTGTGIAAAGILAQFDDVSTGTVTENQFAPVRISTRRALLVEGVASGTNLNVNLAASAATVTVDTELPTAAALTADAVASPTAPAVGAFGLGYNGATWDRIRTANTGRLQVDVITGGGAPPAPTAPLADYVTSAAVAAGAEVQLDSVEAAAKALAQVTVWSSVAFRARVFLVNNGVEATEALAIGGGSPFTGWTWNAPHVAYATLGTTAGADNFRVEFISMDDANAADAHCVFLYQG